MSQPVVPPPIQPPRPQHQPPAPKPLNAGLVAAMVITAFAVTGLAIWAGIAAQKNPGSKKSAAEGKAETSAIDDARRREILIAAGHDPDEEYPLWPVVYNNDYKSVREGGSVVIKGTITNHGTKDLSFVGVYFGLANEQGHRVGSASDTISKLHAGETWSYTAFSFEKEWSQFRLEDIKAW